MFFYFYTAKKGEVGEIMIKTEREFRKYREAVEDKRLDVEGKPVFVNKRGIPYNYRYTLMLRLITILYKIMFKG